MFHDRKMQDPLATRVMVASGALLRCLTVVTAAPCGRTPIQHDSAVFVATHHTWNRVPLQVLIMLPPFSIVSETCR
jgi:hypothetical protein